MTLGHFVLNSLYLKIQPEQVDFDYDKLVAEYQRLSRQWSSELSDVNRLRIDRRMKEIELLLEVS